MVKAINTRDVAFNEDTVYGGSHQDMDYLMHSTTEEIAIWIRTISCYLTRIQRMKSGPFMRMKPSRERRKKHPGSPNSMQANNSTISLFVAFYPSSYDPI